MLRIARNNGLSPGADGFAFRFENLFEFGDENPGIVKATGEHLEGHVFGVVWDDFDEFQTIENPDGLLVLGGVEGEAGVALVCGKDELVGVVGLHGTRWLVGVRSITLATVARTAN